MDKPLDAVALIPARAGSRRIPDKNIRLLGSHPLIAYTIASSRQSGVFSSVVVSTDSEEYADIARHYGAEVPVLRPASMAGELSPDLEWVEFTLRFLQDRGRMFDCFSILRPTSPFRQPSTIQRGWREFRSELNIDSLRAVEKCRQHPGKMWVIRGNRMLPLLPIGPEELPWHSRPYQALPEVFVQNASLEIAWTRVVLEGHTIAGTAILPFFTGEIEGFDLNRPMDWKVAEELVASGEASLPTVEQPPYPIDKRS